MSRSIEDIRFDCLRNALYHTARRRTCETLARWMNLLVIVLGTTAVSSILEPWVSAEYLAAAAAIVGALNMTFDFAGKARDHMQLQSAYYDMLAGTEEVSQPQDCDIAALDARLTRIYCAEPPVLRAIDAKAYNDALESLGCYKPEDRLYIPVWHRGPLAHVFAFEGHEYRRAGA